MLFSLAFAVLTLASKEDTASFSPLPVDLNDSRALEDYLAVRSETYAIELYFRLHNERSLKTAITLAILDRIKSKEDEKRFMTLIGRVGYI